MQHMNTSFCEGQVIAVNPSTGKTTVRNDTEKAAEHLFDIEKRKSSNNRKQR